MIHSHSPRPGADDCSEKDPGDGGAAHVTASRHRVRLAARTRIGGLVVGCSGARVDPETGHPQAALDIVVPGEPPRLEVVLAGDVLRLPGGALEIREINPWIPHHHAGVTVSWSSRA